MIRLNVGVARSAIVQGLANQLLGDAGGLSGLSVSKLRDNYS